MSSEDQFVSPIGSRRFEFIGLLPGEVAFTVFVPLSYAFASASAFVGVRYEISLGWVAATMLVAGAAAAVRVGLYLSAVMTSLVGGLVIFVATLAAPDVTFPFIVPAAALGVVLTALGMWRTERLRTDRPRSS